MNRALGSLAALTLAAAGTTAPAADRSKPPAPGPVRPLKLPAVVSRTLANGIPVMVATMDEVPVVDISVVVRAGAATDPAGKPGLALLTADMLDEGAGGKDALQVEDSLDFLGAEVTAGAAWDHAAVVLHVPVARLEQALPVLAEIVLRPDFPAADLERVRADRLAEFLQSRDEPQDIASAALARAVFGAAHRYGTPIRGTAAAVAGLTRADLQAFHAARYTADRAAIVVTGATSADAVVPLLEKAFGAWAKGSAAAAELPTPAPLRGLAIVLVDKPDAAQSVIRFGAVGPSRRTPDFATLEVLNTLLGGSFSSRLNSNIRERNGYGYSASSRFDYRGAGGSFVAAADVQTDKTAPAVSEFMNELRRIRTLPTAAEAERTRNYKALGYGATLETTRQLGAKLAAAWVYGLSVDGIAAFVPDALAVDPPRMQKAAAAWIDPARMALVVVGDRKTVEAPLRALNLGTVSVRSIDEVLGPAPRAQ